MVPSNPLFATRAGEADADVDNEAVASSNATKANNANEVDKVDEANKVIATKEATKAFDTAEADEFIVANVNRELCELAVADKAI